MYLLFAWESHEQCGGIHDYYGMFPDMPSAVAAIKKVNIDKNNVMGFGQIVRHSDMKEVAWVCPDEDSDWWDENGRPIAQYVVNIELFTDGSY